MDDPQLILVNELDEEIGFTTKSNAHATGLLHRAVSVFILNSNQELLLQKRSLGKYHSPGLWTNTCCSHPFPNESSLMAATRRLKEEMGISCALQEAFTFTYKHQFSENLWEHEFDHVFIGYCDVKPLINQEEVMDFKYANTHVILEQLQLFPNQFTVWFRICFPIFYKFIHTINP